MGWRLPGAVAALALLATLPARGDVAELVAQQGHSRAIKAVAMSADGRWVASGADDGQVVLWHLQTGLEIRRFAILDGDVTALAFSSDGGQLAAGTRHGSVALWSLDRGEEVCRWSPDGEPYVSMLAFDPQGRHLLVADDTTWEADVATCEIRHDWPDVTAAAYFDDGDRMAQGTRDGILQVIQRRSGRQSWTVASGGGPVEAVFVFRTADGEEGIYCHTDWAPVDSAIGDSFLGIFTSEGQGTFLDAWDLLESSIKPGWVHPTLGLPLYLEGDDAGDGPTRLWCLLGLEPGSVTIGGHMVAASTWTGSPSGEFLISGDYAGNVFVHAVDWATGETSTFRRLSGRLHRVDALTSTADAIVMGSRIVTDPQWQRWTEAPEAHSGDGVPRREGRPGRPVDTTLAAPRRRPTITTWDTSTGAVAASLLGHDASINALDVDESGRWALSGSDDETVRLWDLRDSAEVQRFEGFDTFVRAVALAPDGSFGYAGGGSAQRGGPYAAYRVEPIEGTLGAPRFIDEGWGHGAYYVNAIDLSEDGDRVLLAQGGSVAVLDATTGEARLELHGGGRLGHAAVGADEGSVVEIGDATWLPGCTALATADEDGYVRVYNGSTGELTRELQVCESPLTSIAVQSAEDRIAIGTENGRAYTCSLAAGEACLPLDSRAGADTEVAFVGDSGVLATGGDSGVIRLWRAATGEHLCDLHAFLDGSWAVIDPVGRFDGTAMGRVEGLHWRLGNEPIALDQLRQHYYTPNLLPRVLRGDPLPDVESVGEHLRLPPGVTVTRTPGEASILEIVVEDRGGGIGALQVFVNGVGFDGDWEARGTSGVGGARTYEIDVSGAVSRLPGETNVVEVVPWTARGTIPLRGRGAAVRWADTEDPLDVPAELWAVVVGVSDYEGDEIDLAFAARDALAFATALDVAGTRLFGQEHVHVTLLADVDDSRARPPTRGNIEAALADARDSGPHDTLVVFLSGHGIGMAEEESSYAFLTADASSASPEDLRDPVLRQRTAITAEELTDWSNRIPALRKVIVLDTCAAGAAAGTLAQTRLLAGDRERALARYTDRSGAHVLMGSAADRVSYEASRYGQGLLTYALLEGMRGAALIDDSQVDVSRLFGYAVDRVPDLARDIGGVQRPRTVSRDGASFVFGMVLEEDKAAIPLETSKRLLLRPRAEATHAPVDPIAFEPLLRAALRSAVVDSPDAGCVYVDADQMPDAIRPGIRYEVRGKRVHVTVYLVQDDHPVVSSKLTGSVDALEKLASRVAREIVQRTPASP